MPVRHARRPNRPGGRLSRRQWAVARGDSPELIARAQGVMLQPNPGGVHDDHLHVRTTCAPEGAP